MSLKLPSSELNCNLCRKWKTSYCYHHFFPWHGEMAQWVKLAVQAWECQFKSQHSRATEKSDTGDRQMLLGQLVWQCRSKTREAVSDKVEGKGQYESLSSDLHMCTENALNDSFLLCLLWMSRDLTPSLSGKRSGLLMMIYVQLSV